MLCVASRSMDISAHDVAVLLGRTCADRFLNLMRNVIGPWPLYAGCSPLPSSPLSYPRATWLVILSDLTSS
eukprot:UN1709